MLMLSRPSYDLELQWMTELSEHLEPILAAARSTENKRDSFYKSYDTWLHFNKQSINSCTEARDRILVTNRNDNYVSVGSAVIGIAGSIMTIIGKYSAEPTGLEPLIPAGEILALGSAIVLVGSNIRKLVTNKSLCEAAAKKLERYKTATVSFDAESKSYFESLDEFNAFFDTINGNDVALALFYEAACDEEFSFLDALNLDRLSRNEVRSTVERIIESDVTNMNPRMWSVEFVRGTSNKVKSLAEKIRKMIHELKRIIENDPYLSRILFNKYRMFLILKRNDIRVPNAGETIKTLFAQTMAATLTVSLSSSNLDENIIPYLKGMSNAACVSLMALNSVFAVVGIFSLIKSLKNLVTCSQSEECKNMTQTIDNLKKIKQNVMDEVGKSFQW